jgi:hypothetical protein
MKKARGDAIWHRTGPGSSDTLFRQDFILPLV